MESHRDLDFFQSLKQEAEETGLWNPDKKKIAKPQQPTIGRIVNYFTDDDGSYCAALITDVMQTSVNLYVFPNTGPAYSLIWVEYGTGKGQWSWPKKV